MGETGSEINEGNFNYILLERVADVEKKDIEIFKNKLDPVSQEKFDTIPEEDKNLFVVLDKLTDAEFSLVYNLKVSHVVGLHDLKNKMLVYTLLSRRKIKR